MGVLALPALCLPVPHGSDGFVAVQSWHVNVHQDYIEAVRLHHSERLPRRPAHARPTPFEKNSGQHEAFIGVLGHQNAQAGLFLVGRFGRAALAGSGLPGE